MKIELIEHTAPKVTRWGTVQKSLNQHIVKIGVEQPDGSTQMVHCGYVGDTAFLPLSGFPEELVGEVTAECAKLLNRDLTSVDPPPSLRQIQQMLQGESGTSEDDE